MNFLFSGDVRLRYVISVCLASNRGDNLHYHDGVIRSMSRNALERAMLCKLGQRTALRAVFNMHRAKALVHEELDVAAPNSGRKYLKLLQ